MMLMFSHRVTLHSSCGSARDDDWNNWIILRASTLSIHFILSHQNLNAVYFSEFLLMKSIVAVHDIVWWRSEWNVDTNKSEIQKLIFSSTVENFNYDRTVAEVAVPRLNWLLLMDFNWNIDIIDWDLRARWVQSKYAQSSLTDIYNIIRRQFHVGEHAHDLSSLTYWNSLLRVETISKLGKESELLVL